MMETLFVLRHGVDQKALLDRVRAMLARRRLDESVECVEAGGPVGECHEQLFAAMRSTRNVVMIDLDDPQLTPEQIVNRVERWRS